MKKTGIIDHFEGDYIYVEIGENTVKIPREGAPAMLAEGTVVIVEDGRIVDVDEIETQRMENDMAPPIRAHPRRKIRRINLRQHRTVRAYAIMRYCLICTTKFPKKARRNTWKRNLF